MAKITIDVIGESPKDQKYVKKIADLYGGKIIDIQDHPKVGDYGAALFKVVFTSTIKARQFEIQMKNLGFIV